MVTRSNSGTIYGAAAFEGANGFGTLFQLDTDSTFTVLANFDFPGPAYPVAEPLLLADGTLVGSANYGGAFGTGALYTFPVGGPLSIIHSFGSSDGAVPISGLHQHTDGLIYGTTTSGGNGYGTVFRFTLAGALDYVHLFEFDGIDGSNPHGGLVAGPGGELFGTTFSGGDEGLGTIYKIDAAGDYAQTHSLVEAEGGSVYDALTLRIRRESLLRDQRRQRDGDSQRRRNRLRLPARVHVRRGLRSRLEPRGRPRRQLLRRGERRRRSRDRLPVDARRRGDGRTHVRLGRSRGRDLPRAHWSPPRGG